MAKSISRTRLAIHFARLVVVVCALIVFALPLLSRPARAITNSDLLSRTLLNALPSCFSNNYYSQSELKGSELQNYGASIMFTDAGRENANIYIPNQILGPHTTSATQVTCAEAFNGLNRDGGTMPGLLATYGKIATNPTDFGYDPSNTSSTDTQGCISIRYSAPDANNRVVDHTTNSVCFELTPDQHIAVSDPDANNPVVVNGDGTGGPVSIGYSDILGLFISINGSMLDFMSVSSPYNKTWDEFVAETTAFVSGADYPYGSSGPINAAADFNGESLNMLYQGIDAPTSAESTFDDYTKSTLAALRTLRYLTGDGSANFDSIQFTEEEAYDVYDSYFTALVNDGSLLLSSECFASRDQVSSEYAYYDAGAQQWCGVQIGNDVDLNQTFNVINTDTYMALRPESLAGILTTMSNWDFGYADNPDAPIVEGVTDSGTAGDDSSSSGGALADLSACYDAAGVLGWFVCPVLEAVGGVASAVYDNIVENLLVVDPNWINEGGTRSGWEIFRDIANLIFAILFIIVILSQVTGVGVSNYGIKKILPRLIAVAVLVNVSFIICQLAVDLSNILGSGLNSLFEGLAQQVKTSTGHAGEPFNLGDLIKTVIGLGGSGTAIIAGIKLATLNWDIWLWPLLLVLIGIVIGIIFFFILLGARQAGVIILVALAPVAIVCYALPNTKKLFDRWLQIFVALLLLYPLCGILMGGGKFASTLIINNAGEGDIGFLLTLVAMLLSVVPFFFIPSLLRSSMNALGNLGTKISGFGSKLSSGATGALRRSERLQEWNKRNRVTGDYRRAQRTIERANRRGKALSPSQDRRIARAKAAMERQGKEDAANRLYAMRTGKQMEAAVAAAEAEAIEKDVQEAAAAFSTQFKNEGLDYNLDEMQRIHAEALTDLTRDPENREAKAKLIAAQNILAATDKGRGLMKNNFYSATDRLQASGTGHNDGFSWAARQLHREHGGAIKAHDRSFEKYLTDAGKDLSAVKGKFAAGTVGFDGDGKAIAGFASSHYDSSDISGYTASTLADIDEGALDRWIATAKTSAISQISDEDKARLISLTEDTLTNDNITVQPKIVEKLNTLRAALGEEPITPASRSAAPTDSGPLSVRTSTSAQAPIPDNATVTESGLIITHDMTDRQIDEFARRMDQFNRQNNQNPQPNPTPQNNQPPSNQQSNTPPRP